MTLLLPSFYEKLAKLVVDYSLKIQPGQRVVITGSTVSTEAILAMYAEVLRAGAHPTVYQQPAGIKDLLYRMGNDDQLKYVDPFFQAYCEKFDKEIYLMDEYNSRKFERVDPLKIKLHESNPEKTELVQLSDDRTARGEFQWVIAPIPCQALAQEGGMDLYTYTDFVVKALHLNAENPADEWHQIHQNQEKYVDYLTGAEQIRVVGEDTDLTMTVKGRTWINCSGQDNLPDGEVFTGPIEDSISGHIRFTYPGIYQGKEIENIYLEFKQGKVVTATASKGQELLNTILEIEGAKGVGEFAIGTNFGITQFTRNMLFDEKMGGTLHMALGGGYGESGSLAKSAIHWDLLKDISGPDAKIYADGKPFYEAGKWVI